MNVLSRIAVGMFGMAVLSAPISSAQEGSISISNFPDTQTVDGEVEIAEPIPSNEMKRFTDTTVTTVNATKPIA